MFGRTRRTRSPHCSRGLPSKLGENVGRAAPTGRTIAGRLRFRRVRAQFSQAYVIAQGGFRFTAENNDYRLSDVRRPEPAFSVELPSTAGSRRDILDDAEVLSMLREYNRIGKVLHRPRWPAGRTALRHMTAEEPIWSVSCLVTTVADITTRYSWTTVELSTFCGHAKSFGVTVVTTSVMFRRRTQCRGRHGDQCSR
jgi:hypothetical protein